MSTLFTRRAIFVVTSGHKSAANNKAKEVDTIGGERTFNVGLSSDGSGPPTHYWCNWQLTLAMINAIINKFNFTEIGNTGHYTNGIGDHGYDARRWTPDEVLADLGLKRITTAG